jgi:hypothetical protein
MALKPLAVDLAAQGSHRCRWGGVLHPDRRAGFSAEFAVGVFRQADFRFADDRRVVDDIERREDRTPVGLHFDP